MTHLVRPDGLPPANGYSHVVSAQGTVVHVSGQVPLDAEANLVGAGDITLQTEQVFSNLAIALAAAGCSWSDVVKMTYFLTDLEGLPEVRAVRDRHIESFAPPASSLVQVAALVHPQFLIEIDAVAVLALNS